MQLFVLTLHCTSRAHCKVCRNLEGGRTWRQKINKTYPIPEAPAGAADPADFECPYGVAWNSVPTPQPPSQPKPIIAETSPNGECRGCSEAQRQARLMAQTKVDAMRNSASRGERKGCGCSRNQ